MLDHYWRTDPNGKAGLPLVSGWFYTIWPEWPEKPYLSVRLNERLSRFRKTWPKQPKRQLRLVPLREIYRCVGAVKAGKPPMLPIASHINRLEMREDVWVIPKGSGRETPPPIEIVAFELDFGLPDELLTARLRNWLVQRRKDMGYQRPDRRPTRVDRGDLIALGAMRLMDFGLSIKKAMDYSSQRSGKALFEDVGDWSRARKRAKDAIYRAS